MLLAYHTRNQQKKFGARKNNRKHLEYSHGSLCYSCSADLRFPSGALERRAPV